MSTDSVSKSNIPENLWQTSNNDERTHTQVVTANFLDEGTVSTGEKLPDISSSVTHISTDQPRMTNLGEIEPHLSKDHPNPEVTKHLTTSIDATTEEGRSIVKTETALSPKVQDMALVTNKVAFNILEKFVAIFDKKEALNMQIRRLDGITSKAMQSVLDRDPEKAEKTIIHAACGIFVNSPNQATHGLKFSKKIEAPPYRPIAFFDNRTGEYTLEELQLNAIFSAFQFGLEYRHALQ